MKIKYIENPVAEKAFFSLVRAGLWPKQMPDASLFNEKTDWEAILRLSMQQTVLGLVWDGMSKLPAELQPAKAVKLKWYSIVLRYEQANELINKSVVEMTEAYQQNGLHPILLKGAGLATLYPNPLHRCAGDMDIYIGPDDYAKANEIALSMGFVMHEESDNHSHLNKGKLCLENHRKVVSIYSPALEREFLKELSEWYPNGADTVEINGKAVPVPPMEFNVLFVFLHMYKHFVLAGVGLRQLCDWAVLLDRANLKEINLEGCLKGWQYLGQFLVDYLGLDPAKLPHYEPSFHDKVEIAKDMILIDGNFGFNDSYFYSMRPKGYWAGKLFSLRYQSKRWVKVFNLLPAETIKFLFGYRFAMSFRRIVSDMGK